MKCQQLLKLFVSSVKLFGGVDHSDFLTKLNYYGIHDLELEFKKNHILLIEN